MPASGANRIAGPGWGAMRVLGALAGAIAWTAAAATGAVLALIFAATLVVMSLTAGGRLTTCVRLFVLPV